MKQIIELDMLQKIRLIVCPLAIFMSCYGAVVVISVMTSFPDDVNMFAVTISLILFGLISAGCMTMIIDVFRKDKEINNHE